MTSKLKPQRLRCEYRQNPLGVAAPAPRLSWIVTSDERDQMQHAYQILVASSEERLAAAEGDLWNTGKVVSDETQNIPYAGQPFASEQRCYWAVRVWDGDDVPSAYSPPAYWQAALLADDDWQARWIYYDVGEPPRRDMKPAPYLRRSFQLGKPIARATLHITARGLYEAYFNGERVGDRLLTPGWTEYTKRILYQSYDVTDLLQDGQNVAGVVLGDGWYVGYIGYREDRKRRSHYGSIPELLFQLNVEHTDGSRRVITSDEDWRASDGPIRYSDPINGEYYDARMELAGWSLAGYDDTVWQPVRSSQTPPVQLDADASSPIRRQKVMSAASFERRDADTVLVDFGQNMVGWVRLRLRGKSGTTVKMRFSEVLEPDGSLHTANLRTAEQTDTYILRGDDDGECFEPSFTHHGFRYVEVTGYPGELGQDDITAHVIYADMDQTGTFETDHPMVNRLWENILWSQRSNFLSVPTDCPQRDERMGWLGDAQTFAQTAAYNMDIAAFMSKWMVDIADAQSDAGGFPEVAPRIIEHTDGAPAWGDAGVIIPYIIYRTYNDTRIIERHYGAMARWMTYIGEANPDYLWRERLSRNFSDWVHFNQETDGTLLGTAYWAYDAALMAEMATAVGKQDDATRYRELFEKIRAAFIKAYVQPDGQIEPATQTAYVLALHMRLMPEDLRERAAAHLVDCIKARDWHLATGFVGTAYLCEVLTWAGYADVAYRLLLNDTLPSWGFTIKHGATTIWERWDAIKTPDTENVFAFDGAPDDMNSYNHYSLGSVGEWLYRYVAGIDRGGPGFRQIHIQPTPGNGLGRAHATYQSPAGPISVHWERAHGQFSLAISIPANTRATVWLPPQMDANTLAEASGYVPSSLDDGKFELPSGAYKFTAKELSS